MSERDVEGRVIALYEGDEARGGPKGRLHRVLITPRKSGVFKVALMRNFDIFSEVEAHVPGGSSKL